jgi:5-hydroxyisourate hydrolase
LAGDGGAPAPAALDLGRSRSQHRATSRTGGGDEDSINEMSGLTTHILDLAAGRPAADVAVALFRAGAAAPLITLRTDADGRCRLLDGEALTAGGYRLAFSIGDHFRASGAAVSEPPFLDVVMLVSPFGYSTYRGS